MSVKSQKIRLGTRGSPLALKQAEMVREALAAAWPDLQVETVVIKTSGDWTPAQGDRALPESQGGKALFAKEIEEALLAGTIDAGVHSMKDMDSCLPEGLTIAAMLEREDPRDCLIFQNEQAGVRALADLPRGFIIGTCSVRRAAFLRAQRPDLGIVPLRGNVETRLEKLRRGEQGMQAIVLARAGLKRLGIEIPSMLILEPEEMLPAAAQGAVGIEVRQGDEDILSIFGQINHFETMMCVSAERAVLKILNGGCRTPVGVFSTVKGAQLSLRFCVAAPDGSVVLADQIIRPVSTFASAEALGAEAGERLKSRIPPALLKEIFG